MNFHVLAGLPRSGSTLLANVLTQHPDIYVSGTSPLAAVFGGAINALDGQPEVVAEMANVPGAREGYIAGFRGLIDGWYSTRDESVIVDKGRGWALHVVALSEILPEARILMMVRDPRDVIASIEKQHRKTGMFPSPIAPTVYESADILMSPEGMVGGPIRFIEDCVRRGLPNVDFVRYETFVADPITTLNRISTSLNLDSFSFDVENVENVAPDLDPLYRGKYPHEGSGPIKPQGSNWTQIIEPNLAAAIAGRWPFYMQTFGYQ